ncbi:MAG TPA: response regulator transcription factor [Oculatellaceae cyanobacterium]
MANILLVEDDKNSAAFVSTWLHSQRHDLQVVNDGGEALEKMLASEYDVILLDWNLPNACGISILREFRKTGKNTPVIMITGRGDLRDKEVGLDSGADDFLAKPFDLVELSARIRVQLRRPHHETHHVVVVGNITLDPERLKVTVRGKDMRLSVVDFMLLEFFMRNPNRMLRPDKIIEYVWPVGTERSPDALRTSLKRLRTKFKDLGEPDNLIETIHKVGYRFNSRVMITDA